MSNTALSCRVLESVRANTTTEAKCRCAHPRRITILHPPPRDVCVCPGEHCAKLHRERPLQKKKNTHTHSAAVHLAIPPGRGLHGAHSGPILPAAVRNSDVCRRHRLASYRTSYECPRNHDDYPELLSTNQDIYQDL